MIFMTGGCQCGHVRYEAKVGDTNAYLCHCRMCQRATGGVSIAFKSLAKSDVVWKTQPEWYTSSPIARRPFCAKCGTPLGFAFNDSEYIDLTVGSFDDPSKFVPTENFGIESRHSAWEDTSHLPSKRVDEHEPVVRRWKAALGKLPE